MFMKWSTENSSPDTGVLQKRNWRRAMLAFMCGTLLLTSACSLLPDEAEEEVLPSITEPTISKKPEYEVTKKAWVSSASGSGKIMSEQEETVFFTLDNKPIKDVLVKNGDTVKAGQTIAVLDVDDMQKDLRQKRLALRKDEVELKGTLRQKDEMDPVQFEEAQILYEEKRQAIADLETDIAKGTVTSPFAGVIVSLNVKKGATSKKYDPVATIANTSLLTVAAQMSKDDLKKVAPGMEVEVSVNTVDNLLKGKVKALPMPTNDNNNNGRQGNEPDQDRLDKYMTVELLDKLPASVMRGTPLSVTVIVERRKDVTVIPLAALRTIGSRTYVQVIDEKGKREVDVEVGAQKPTEVEIKSGLEPGQKVVGR
ncbi:efflux RND transporter periplasmic adaptor subunit [Paenibacillus sp. MER TA 81-3]|uniref:efflux RND transporter periplasmic adaptor subunit n=1 Tax=Paenibacillus sp. MER TA 81-3 TaxID=2939573 RepID=UPI00203EFC55|nr:efflux RND transporter periplasmic adaptor subunit [Paenibacillus sp. MER TA 81-3]MCM3337114.1 efflux RND transporter periplasmic adaptor subunit [Paenibacillus sp. MER TA 81-3]